MQTEINIGDYVEIVSKNVRFGHRGKIVNISNRENIIYAVEFDDGCVGYFETCELKKGNKEIPDLE